MGTLITIVTIAAAIGGTILNHRNANFAFAGVEDEILASRSDVATATAALYTVGVKAKARSAVSANYVVPGGKGFRYGTKMGDEGTIELVSTGTGTTVLRARTNELFVGNPNFKGGSGWWALGQAMSHGVSPASGMGPPWAGFRQWDGTTRSPVMGPPGVLRFRCRWRWACRRQCRRDQWRRRGVSGGSCVRGTRSSAVVVAWGGAAGGQPVGGDGP